MADRDEPRVKIGELNNEPIYAGDAPVKPEKPSESPKSLSEGELFRLKKAEQVELLKSLGVTDIPQYENDRVELILNLKGGTN